MPFRLTLMKQPVLPSIIERQGETGIQQTEFSMPRVVAAMLEDPTLDEHTKADIKRSSTLIGGHLSQILGGVYRYNLDGTTTFRKPRQSAAKKAKLKLIISNDAPEYRNELNVSECRL